MMKLSTSTLKNTLATLMIAKVGMLSAFVNSAFANELPYNVVNFEVSAQAQVENDEATAVLNKTATAKDAKALANQLNPIINQALTLAKKYPNVITSTGQQYSYPSYDNKGKVNGLTGSASINLKSQDMQEFADLLGELQAVMTVDDIRFGVSDKLREQTQNRLMSEATQKFKAQADAITKAWGAKSYRLVKMDMNTTGFDYHRVSVAPMMAVAQAADASYAKQQIQAGESDVRYTINGSIQLVY